MSFPCAGAFGGVITRAELMKPSGDSQSRSFSLFVEFDEFYWTDRDPQEWGAMEKFEAEVPNWIVKKDGTLNDAAIEKLAAIIGFNGVETDYAGLRVRVDVQAEEYKGQTTFKPKWLNHSEWTPSNSSFTSVNPSELSQFNSRFGAQIRAKTARPGSAPVPNGRPKSPARPGAAQPAPAAAGVNNDDIPFD